MRSRRTARFREAFEKLPNNVQEQARTAYALFMRDPWHPSLHFKLVSRSQPVYSIRIGLGYRALGFRDGETIAWFWIGSHGDYDVLVSRL